MPYRYLEGIVTADVAFAAWGGTLEDLFTAAADATANVMVEDLAAIACREQVRLTLEHSDIEMLLFDFLGELIYLKDARRLLLRVQSLAIGEEDGTWRLTADLSGEAIDPARHRLIVDVKAVTLHLFELAATDGGWQATVVLDI